MNKLTVLGIVVIVVVVIIMIPPTLNYSEDKRIFDHMQATREANKIFCSDDQTFSDSNGRSCCMSGTVNRAGELFCISDFLD